MSYYLIRIGAGSEYIEEAKKGSFIAIGWNEVPNLKELRTLDKIKKAIDKSSYDYTPAKKAMEAGQIFRFINMQSGDIVFSPLGHGKYLVGKVGDYYFEESPKDSCPYKHRRQVIWKRDILSKEDMTTNLAYSLGAIMTIFSLDKYSKEIESLLNGIPVSPAEKPQNIREIILSSLLDLDGKEFEEFVRHLLEIIGFSADTTQYIGDKGIDVNGTLDAEGLASITLRVQVKRIRSSISNKEDLALRGALGQSEHGCLITTSTFTKQAQEEAEASGKINIKLIDGNDLAGLILKHFDEIDEQYRQNFGIRKKKDFNIEDQFELIMGDIDIEEEIIKGAEIPDWDTIVCPAKEEGFNVAFLGKKAWWAIRLRESSIPFIKYIAIYQVAPLSKITYYGEVDYIEPYENTSKYIVYLKGEPIKLKTPIGLGKNKNLHVQSTRHTRLDKILNALTLDDVF